LVNQVVNLQDERLSRTFAALSDPTRRALIARLQVEKSLSVSALAEPFSISLPAVMKHLDHLAAAGIVTRAKRGRVVTYSLTPLPLEAARLWLERHHNFWSDSLDRLESRAKAAKPRNNP
jgi:DNA-binding transcriptional ArsR family regulator